MKIRITQDDADRLGCPRDLEFEFDRVMGRELMALEEQVGWAFHEFEKEMQGEPLAEPVTGAPVWETDEHGKLVTDPKTGKPVQARGLRVKQLMVMVWLCVFRANPAVAWATFDVNLMGAEFSDDGPAGKDEAASAASTPSTKSPSRKRSGSHRGSKAG